MWLFSQFFNFSPPFLGSSTFSPLFQNCVSSPLRGWASRPPSPESTEVSVEPSLAGLDTPFRRPQIVLLAPQVLLSLNLPPAPLPDFPPASYRIQPLPKGLEHPRGFPPLTAPSPDGAREMWWGGRGQSFNIAPQKEEPEMGVRRGKGLGGGVCHLKGANGDDVEKEKNLEEAEGMSHISLWLTVLGLFCSLKFIVSLSINQPLPPLTICRRLS